MIRHAVRLFRPRPQPVAAGLYLRQLQELRDTLDRTRAERDSIWADWRKASQDSYRLANDVMRFCEALEEMAAKREARKPSRIRARRIKA